MLALANILQTPCTGLEKATESEHNTKLNPLDCQVRSGRKCLDAACCTVNQDSWIRNTRLRPYVDRERLSQVLTLTDGKRWMHLLELADLLTPTLTLTRQSQSLP